MSIPNGRKSRFRWRSRLRWQLTFRFAGATIATLLLVLIGVFGFLFYHILVANWRLSPETWVEVAGHTAVPTTRHILADERENDGMIAMWLSYVANPTSIFRLIRIEDVELTLRTTSSASSFLFDAGGTLLGASNRSGFESLIGQRFEKAYYPRVGQSVDAALRGETDPKLLVRPAGEDERAFSVAIPVFGEGTSADRLLGVLAVSFDSLSTDTDVAIRALRSAVIASLVLMGLTSAVGVLFAFLTARPITSRVASMAAIVDRWSVGDFGQFIGDEATDEVGALSDRLDFMATEMSALLREREKTAVTEERGRMARDLHDSVKQTALAASFHIATALSVIEADGPRAMTHLREADELLDQVRTELGSLIDGAYAAASDEKDLVSMVRTYVFEWSRRAEIETSVNLTEIPGLCCSVADSLFRIVQEALANVARHSGASHAYVHLGFSDGMLAVEIRDNGVGFEVQPGAGVGLRSMWDRSRELGGTLTIDTSPGSGTRVRVEIPTG